jgi:membrane protease YdiL (CAAX protease family)
MTTQEENYDHLRVKPSIWLAFFIYFGYVVIFTATWIINKVEYLNIGKNAETARLWYATPTLLGCLFLVITISYLGWWRIVLFDKIKSGPIWAWLLPIVMAGLILLKLVHLKTENISQDLWLWSMLGAIGVGLGEEMITRGSMVVALRTQFSEGKVWLFSTLLFSALHIPNVFFGVPFTSMLIQLVLTFIMGSALYVIRRLSGTLLLPMLLHGLWDTSLFLNQASGSEKSALDLLIYPIAILCVIPVIKRNWNANIN